MPLAARQMQRHGGGALCTRSLFWGERGALGPQLPATGIHCPSPGVPQSPLLADFHPPHRGQGGPHSPLPLSPIKARWSPPGQRGSPHAGQQSRVLDFPWHRAWG